MASVHSYPPNETKDVHVATKQPRAFYVAFFVFFPLVLAGAVALLVSQDSPSPRLYGAVLVLALCVVAAIVAKIRGRV